MTNAEAKETESYMLSEGFSDVQVSDWRNGEFSVYGVSPKGERIHMMNAPKAATITVAKLRKAIA